MFLLYNPPLKNPTKKKHFACSPLFSFFEFSKIHYYLTFPSSCSTAGKVVSIFRVYSVNGFCLYTYLFIFIYIYIEAPQFSYFIKILVNAFIYIRIVGLESYVKGCSLYMTVNDYSPLTLSNLVIS